MVAEDRPLGRGKPEVQGITGTATTPDSSPTDKGSDFFTINDKGEYCVGVGCFAMRFKPGGGEIKVTVDRNECGADADEIIGALFGEVMKGVPTVYETSSVVK